MRHVEIQSADCTLDLENLRSQLNRRTRLVAVGCASNITGTVNPVRQICGWARDMGALTFLDAVHYAPHDLIDVQDWGSDFLSCSAYKVFGPHVGILWGRRSLLEQITPYKLRPAPDDLPGKWMSGTQNHEGIMGTRAAIDYLADLGRHVGTDAQLARRPALRTAFAAIRQYETERVGQLLEGLQQLPDVKVWGITDPQRFAERVPTVSFTHARRHPAELAAALGNRGLFVWHGNNYALPLTEALGLEPEGVVRVGLVHYNTPEEVSRFLSTLAELV